MKTTLSLQFKNPSREQFHPNLEDDFPCITSHVKINEYRNGIVPWHWHEEVELFYIEDGILEYNFPNGKLIFSKGSGGFVNSNLIHQTKCHASNTLQYLHIFNTSLIGGSPGSRIERKFIFPVINAPQIDIVPLSPDIPEQAELLKELRASFYLNNDAPDYEITLRNALSKIWYGFFKIIIPFLSSQSVSNKVNDKLKAMIIYIHEHYSEKLSVKQIASAAFISERECFRIFQNYLYITPVEYLKNYRIQKACYLLVKTSESITSVGLSCGFESSSYFIKTFREKIGCTPQSYRKMAE